MVLRNLNIGPRLALGFGAILAILVVVAVGGIALGKSSRAGGCWKIEEALTPPQIIVWISTRPTSST